MGVNGEGKKDEGHSVCERCWVEMRPGEWPVRAPCIGDHAHQCCFCENMTWAGIYVLDGDPQHCDHEAMFGPDPDFVRGLRQALKNARWN